MNSLQNGGCALKINVKTIVVKLSVNGNDEEVKAHTNNITCVVDSKQSTRNGCLESKAF